MVAVVVLIGVILFIESRLARWFGECIDLRVVALEIFHLLEREKVL